MTRLSSGLTDEEERRRLARFAERFDADEFALLCELLAEHKDEQAFRRRLTKLSRYVVWVFAAVASFAAFRNDLAGLGKWLSAFLK